MATRMAQDVPVASASDDGIIGSGARSQATDTTLGASASGGKRARWNVETVIVAVGLWIAGMTW
jgi:hypothetical protein